MAQRSAYEVIAALEIAINLKMSEEKSIKDAIGEVDQLSAMIFGLIKSLKADSWRLIAISRVFHILQIPVNNQKYTPLLACCSALIYIPRPPTITTGYRKKLPKNTIGLATIDK